jgi:hypothetical protein
MEGEVEEEEEKSSTISEKLDNESIVLSSEDFE